VKIVFVVAYGVRQLNSCGVAFDAEENVDIIVAEGGIQVVVPLLSVFQPDEPPNLREFVVNRSVEWRHSMQQQA
jgi:hypothetical protein